MFELHAQIRVILARQAPHVFHHAPADLASLPRELDDVTYVQIGGRAGAEGAATAHETRVSAGV